MSKSLIAKIFIVVLVLIFVPEVIRLIFASLGLMIFGWIRVLAFLVILGVIAWLAFGKGNK